MYMHALKYMCTSAFFFALNVPIPALLVFKYYIIHEGIQT